MIINYNEKKLTFKELEYGELFRFPMGKDAYIKVEDIHSDTDYYVDLLDGVLYDCTDDNVNVIKLDGILNVDLLF